MDKYLVEIKARCPDPAAARAVLDAQAVLQGIDHQLDHYFRVPRGRLKLRRGQLERSLIYYERPDQSGPKDSRVQLVRLEDTADQTPEELLHLLREALGEWQCVDKQRAIYWADNVKLHLDEVAGLGAFVEIEAVGQSADEHEVLLQQCRDWMARLQVADCDLVEGSYSDLLNQ